MTERPQEPEHQLLPDELAQRLLARVVELDARGHSETSIGRLREVTRELGIPDATFDRALQELRAAGAPSSGDTELPPAPRSWWRRIIGSAPGRSLTDEVLVNVGVFAAFMMVLRLASRFVSLVGGEWQLRAGLGVLINIVAVMVARRYRARPLTYVLAVTAVMQSVEYVMHLLFGIRAVQGGPTHWAVLASAAVALLAAPLLRLSDKAGSAPEPSEEEANASPPPVPPRRHWWSLLRVPQAT